MDTKKERRLSAPWQGLETMPKSGRFLVAVWEGDIYEPERRLAFYEAHNDPLWSRPIWARSYRTEEGETYRLFSWCPLPMLEEV